MKFSDGQMRVAPTGESRRGLERTTRSLFLAGIGSGLSQPRREFRA